MMLKFRVGIAILGLLFPAALFGDVLEFNNGDRLSGTLVSEADGQIVFQSDLLGQITVPSAQASLVRDEPVTTTASLAADAAEAAEIPALPPADDATETPEERSAVDRFNEGVDRVRSYVDYIVPPGWSGKIDFGVSYIDSNNTSQGWRAAIAAKKISGKNTYALGAFYNYNSQTDDAGVKTKNLDKWGGNFTYARELTERWFLESDTQYLRDLVKDIDHRVTETVSLGYKVINEEDFTFNLLPGVAAQYQEVQGDDQHWGGFVTFGDELMYRFSDIFRVEQSATARLKPTNVHEYQLEFNAAFIAKLNDWVDAKLSYIYTYDTTVGPGAKRSEQQILFGLGVPF